MKKKKKIAILGASYLQLPLVERARELGWQTHCFAWDNDEAVCKAKADFFYPISVLEKERILRQCQKLGIDGILTIATDVCIPSISYIAEKLNLIGNSYRSALQATNKSLMKNCFYKHGVKTPISITLSDIDLNLIKGLNFPLIVKPTDRSGSRGVTKVTAENGLKEAIKLALNNSLEKKVVVEEFVEGIEVSVESISWKKEHYILAITDKHTTGNPHFVELEHHQPSLLQENLLKKIRDETIKALNALEITYGASHTEFKITPNHDIFAIEVGARMGGDFIGSHLVKLSTGYDYLMGVMEIAMNNFTKPKINKGYASGVYFLSQETAYLERYFRKKFPFEVKKERLKKELYTLTNSNDRSGYLIYKNDQRIVLK